MRIIRLNIIPPYNNYVTDDIQQLAINSAQAGVGVHTVEIAGHTVVYKMLNVLQELKASELAKPWDQSEGRNNAIMTAAFALSVQKIDEIIFYHKINNDFDLEAKQRWDKALKYFRGFIQLWYEDYYIHEVEMMNKFEAFKKKSESTTKTADQN